MTTEKMKDQAVRIDNFQIEIEIPVELSERQRVGVEAAVYHCLIHNTLLHPPKIVVEIKEAVRVG
jgi:putative redox protein